MSARPEPIRPYLKWAGGKRSLLPQLLPHLPERFRRYHEPFVGSAALFFHLAPKKAWLSDTNERLVRTYRGLRDDPDGVIERLRRFPHDKEFFLRKRQENIDDAGDTELAAWFIYLNKTGYNGLYRVNSKNVFNVPFGSYKRPKICDEPRLRACAGRLANVEIEVRDFEAAADRARKGDLVYFDPPYVPLSATSSFTSYTRHGFGPPEQERLRDTALRLVERGVHVVISNSSAPLVRELYAGSAFELIEIAARRSINSRGDRRGAVVELLLKGRR
ncbi:MAG: Dam family site-specific DNA-(adenine-N6)-methyltransferase [Polyangiaceae bacterium]